MKSVRANLLWLLSERVVLTLVVFASNVVVIRYLGAERFGELALFQVWLALALTCTEFGLRRVFLALGRAKSVALALAATVRIKVAVGAVLAAAMLAAFTLLESPPEYFLLLAIAALAPLEAYVYHFEAKLRNDLLARIRMALALALASTRVALCLAGFGVPALAATYVLPSVLLWVACRILARREAPAPAAAATRRRAAIVRGNVLHRAAFFFGSVIVLQLHARIEQLLLATLAGSGELGLYAGAHKFLEQLVLLPAILTGVLLPVLSRRAREVTAQRLQEAYFAVFIVSLALAVIFALAARPIVLLVLGSEFAPAGEVLAVLALGIPGLFLASVSGLYYSLNGLERWAIVRNLLGLVLGAALGLVLIPRYGALGAAWSMVVSYTVVAFAVEWAFARLRANAVLKARAFAALVSPASYAALIARMGHQDARQ